MLEYLGLWWALACGGSGAPTPTGVGGRSEQALLLTAPDPGLYAEARFVDAAYAIQARIAELQRGGLEPWSAIRAGVRSNAFPGEDLELEGVYVRRPARDRPTPGAPEVAFSGFVGRHRGTEARVVVLRGAWTHEEWSDALDARLTSWNRLSDARVHEGFKQAYRELELFDRDLKPSSAQTLCSVVGTRDTSTVIVGHSLGAALATLYAVDCAHNGPGDPARIGLVTLGSPLVGDMAFARAARRLGELARVYNHADAVVWSPPSARGYHHVGTRNQRYGYTSGAYGTLRPNLDEPTAWACHHDWNVYLWFLERRHPRRAAPTCWR